MPKLSIQEAMSDPESLAEHRRHLAEMRGLNQRQDEDTFRPRNEAYAKARVILFEDFELDPERAVLDAWLPTAYDRVNTFKQVGDKVDLGDGLGVSVNTGGPFKVRSLHRPSLGEVRQVNAVEYWLIKRAAVGGNHVRYEPVPKDTPLRGPIFPPNFPSLGEGARAAAAKGLRKTADELTVQQILEWYRTKQTRLHSYPA